MAEQFGMLPNRIMPSFTALTSKFKGLGMTTEEAMAQATTATNIAADAAAFYDKSMEESQSALNSFVNGSYEGKHHSPPIGRLIGKHQSKSVQHLRKFYDIMKAS